jgi:cell division septum initiation protein DivIVA
LDIYALLDQLEQLTSDSRNRRLRFGGRVMIDEDELLDIVDQLRTAIPDEIRQGKRTLAERERILSTAQTEAERVVEKATEDAARAVDQERLLAEARAQAEAIVADATRQAEAIRKGADEYAAEVLRGMDGMLTNFLGHIRAGLSELDKERIT